MSGKIILTNYAIQVAADSLVMEFRKKYSFFKKGKIYGVPRGGIPAAYIFMAALKTRHPDIILTLVDDVKKADIVIDDLVDSGKTREKYRTYRGPLFLTLFDKQSDHTIHDKWLVFPWESGAKNDSSANDIPIRLLQYIGEDPNRGGLQETPKRFLKAWKEYTKGYKQNPAEVLKTFKDGAEGYDEMVLVKDIPIYSHCEHHLAPFFGVAHVAYIPGKHIVGLSKIARVVDIFMRRLQVQERLTNQIAEALMTHLLPKGVAVVLDCRHFCMECRGVNLQGVSTVTSKLTGHFMKEPETRKEFFDLIRGR